MPELRIVDVTDTATFALVPPCADPKFDHRSCDYWEDAERGSKAARTAWLEARPAPVAPRSSPNPFLDEDPPAVNPFAPVRPPETAFNPFAPSADRDLEDNPFAPRRERPAAVPTDAPRKLGLLGRGLAVFGSYAKVGLVGDVPVAYSQFGPLSAYPRAARLRDLYPQLPDAPLPAVITCIATTREARRHGYALRLVDAVCSDLGGRGFSAVEAYPERGAEADATSAAFPEFWLKAGFRVAVEDERFPVFRREL